MIGWAPRKLVKMCRWRASRRWASAQGMVRQKVDIYLQEILGSQERGNNFNYSRSKSAQICTINRIILKFGSGEIRYDCRTRDVTNSLRRRSARRGKHLADIQVHESTNALRTTTSVLSNGTRGLCVHAPTRVLRPFAQPGNATGCNGKTRQKRCF